LVTSLNEVAPPRLRSAVTTGPADRTWCGDSVDAVTGQVVRTAVDLERPGVLPLRIRRTHVSGLLAGRAFGPNWVSTVDQRVEVSADAVHLALDDGRVLAYPVPDGTDPVRPVSGERLPLRRTDDGWLLTGPDTRLHFTAGGALHRIDAGHPGAAVELFRDEDGTLTGLAHTGGYRIRVETEDGLVTALEPAAGATVRYRYDEHGLLVEVVAGDRATGYDHDPDGRLRRWADAAGDWYAYEYDDRGRCVSGRGAGGNRAVTLEHRDDRRTEVTDSLGHTTEYRYDEHGRVTEITDPLGGVTRQEWADGGLAGRTDPLGHRTVRTYDVAGNLVEVSDPDGARTVHDYDAHGRCTASTGPDGAVRRREHDERGLLRAETDPAGAVTRYDYDETGAVAAVTDALGGVTRYRNNAAGLPVAVTDALGGVTRYGYDEAGRLRETVDPVGLVTRRDWTDAGELRERVDPDGAVWRWTHEPGVVTAIAPDGARTRTELGPAGPLAITGPDGGTVRCGYDTELRPTSVADPRGLAWTWEYDPAGRLVGETDPDGRHRRHHRDPAGRVVERITAGGVVTALERDECGRVLRRTGPDGEAVFGYDRAGRLTLARNADAEVRIGYDPAGRVLTESVNRRTVTSEYDLLGRRVRLRTPAGPESHWRYDALHRPVELRSDGHTVAFGWDAAGRPVSRGLGAAGLRQDFDAAHRLTAQTLRSGDRILQQRRYTYAPDGLLSDVDDSLSGPRHLTRDAAGRVHTVRGNGWQERYAYDAAGYPVSAEWPAAPDAAALGPRRYAGTLLVAAGQVGYAHDADGRVVARTLPGTGAEPDTWRYRWNADGLLAGVSTPDGQDWRYRYDALGRRTTKQRFDDAGRLLEQMDYAWDGGFLVERVHGGPGLRVKLASWDWEPGAGRAVRQVERPLDAEESRFLGIVSDPDGSPAELVDAQGNLVWHGLPSLWGNPLSGRGSGYTPLRTPGLYQDPETGLLHSLARYRDPHTGLPLTPPAPPFAPPLDPDPVVAGFTAPPG
jgi:YD repeat-containing protein